MLATNAVYPMGSGHRSDVPSPLAGLAGVIETIRETAHVSAPPSLSLPRKGGGNDELILSCIAGDQLRGPQS